MDGFRAAYALWKSRDDIAEELERLERKINRCYQRFSVSLVSIAFSTLINPALDGNISPDRNNCTPNPR